MKSKLVTLLTCVFCLLPEAFAQEENSEIPREAKSSAESPEGERKKSDLILDRMTVASDAEAARIQPGSVSFIGEEALDEQQYGVDDIHRVLRQVPGVNIQEEEGYGLRPNIGFRGVPNERSAKITLMEDGVLIAPAPYSAPSAYYFPPIGRMSGVEVTKGPGQIKYGPYTTGGSLNLLSTPIPEETAAEAKLGVGTDNLRKIYAKVGSDWKYGGVLFETYQLETDGFKKLDGGGDTGVDLEDYQLKIRLNTDPERNFYQSVEYKFGIYDQLSNETYLGLSEEDFGATPFRRYASSALDQIDADHIQHHLRHYVELSDDIDLNTVFYYNETQRNWYKLQSAGGTGLGSILEDPAAFADEFAWIRGDVTSPDDALAIRANQRNYESMGIQSALTSEFDVAGSEHTLEIGARFHSDEEDRFQHEDDFRIEQGTLVLTTEGEPGSQANRVGSADAWAFYVQDTIQHGALTLTPGIRYERINYTREDFGGDDPNRLGSSLRRVDNNVDALIPGASARYELSEELAVFLGVHQGFSPPGPAGNDEVKEEESINYEAGGSFSRNSFDTKLVLFYSDYDNLLGADTLSSGGSGSGDLFNGGEVDVYGVEFNLAYDLAESMDTVFALPFRCNYTFTKAEFANTFDSDFFGDVTDGDEVPYIPEHQAYASIGAEYDAFSLAFEGYFSDSMKTAPGETGAIADKTDSFAVFDVLARWSMNEKIDFYANVENVFDRDYVVARRPAGARPGLPLTAVAGVELRY